MLHEAFSPEMLFPSGLSPVGWVLWAAGTIVLAALLGAVATWVFDLIHWVLHLLMGRPGVLGRIGAMHAAHHHFIDENLQAHPEWERRNMMMHVLPEFITQVLVVFALGIAFEAWLPMWIMQLANIGGFVGNFFYYRGLDFNHRYVGPLPRPPSQLWVTPSYHLLHHAYPDSFFASYLPLVDRLLGKCLPIKGRTFAVTGASGAFGAPLCEMLERRGGRVLRLKHGVDWSYQDLTAARPALAQADVLVLAHGAKVKDAMDANCTSFVAFIELFKSLTLDRRLPPEVWAVGSEIEAHPHFGVPDLKIYSASKRAFARHAWRYYRDRTIQYRHIVPSAFTSPMGPGLLSGRACAAIALFLMRHGFRYVPVTYTGVALLNFAKFVLPLPAAPRPSGSTDRAVAGDGVTPASASPA